MFDELINRLASSCYARCIHRSVMYGNIADVSWEIGLQVGNKIHGFRRIVSTTSRQKSWQPPFPVSDYLWTILPSDGFSEIDVHKNVVKKASVEVVNRVAT